MSGILKRQPRHCGRFFPSLGLENRSFLNSGFGQCRGKRQSAIWANAKATPKNTGQLDSLLFYLQACGLISEQNGVYQATKHTPKFSGARKPASKRTRATVNQTSRDHLRPSHRTRLRAGWRASAIQFSINVQVDMREFAGWTSDRITAFFGGIAAVLAAKGDD